MGDDRAGAVGDLKTSGEVTPSKVDILTSYKGRIEQTDALEDLPPKGDITGQRERFRLPKYLDLVARLALCHEPLCRGARLVGDDFSGYSRYLVALKLCGQVP